MLPRLFDSDESSRTGSASEISWPGLGLKNLLLATVHSSRRTRSSGSTASTWCRRRAVVLLTEVLAVLWLEIHIRVMKRNLDNSSMMSDQEDIMNVTGSMSSAELEINKVIIVTIADAEALTALD